MLTLACSRKGCTDPKADNYDKNAVKARNNECKYDIPTTSPCGNQVEFCAEINKKPISGNLLLTQYDESIVLHWQDSDSIFQQLDIEIFGIKEGNFGISNTGESGTFKVTYVDPMGSYPAYEGSLTISKYNDNVGINGFFEVEMSNGKYLELGYLYRVN